MGGEETETKEEDGRGNGERGKERKGGEKIRDVKLK